MYEDYLSPLDVPGDGDCTDYELASVLDRAIVLQLPDIFNETTDNGNVSNIFAHSIEFSRGK